MLKKLVERSRFLIRSLEGVGVGFREWWDRQPSWFRWLISGVVVFVMSLAGALAPTGFYWFYAIVGVQGIAIAFAIVVPIFLALIFTQKYVLDVISGKLDVVVDVLMKIAGHMGVEVGEEVQSPGYVYTVCRWLRISREEIRDSVHRIYVYCIHPQKTYGYLWMSFEMSLPRYV